MPSNLCTFVLCVLNLVLGWLAGRHLLLTSDSEVSESIRWGLFSGEMLFAVTWISLGPCQLHRRIITTLNWGLCLSISTWVGFLIGSGWSAWAYRTEFGYVATQLPIAVFIASTPLLLFRIQNLLVFGHEQDARSQGPSDVASLLVATLLIAIPLAVRGFSQVRIADDLFWACMFGFLSAILVFPIVPLIVIAYFREKLNFLWMVAPIVTFVALSQLVAAMFPVPSGGGSYIANREAAIFVFVAVAVASILCFEKRLQGYRIQRKAK